jgi:hypothetical protein
LADTNTRHKNLNIFIRSSVCVPCELGARAHARPTTHHALLFSLLLLSLSLSFTVYTVV